MFIYILTSHNIAERIKQCSHRHSNLNGYCDARVTQKFKWTWHWRKNQVIRPCSSTDSQEKFSIISYNEKMSSYQGNDWICDIIARPSTNLEQNDRVSRITCHFSKMGKKIMRDMELLFRGVISVRGFVIESIFEVGFSGKPIVLPSRIDDGDLANFHADPLVETRQSKPFFTGFISSVKFFTRVAYGAHTSAHTDSRWRDR